MSYFFRKAKIIVDMFPILIPVPYFQEYTNHLILLQVKFKSY